MTTKTPIVLDNGKHVPLADGDTLPSNGQPSVRFSITLRSGEMEVFNSGYDVWNGQWGLGNWGDKSATIDASTGAIVVPVGGMYRVTGMMSGTAAANGTISGYLNQPKDICGDPAYPHPYYFGCRTAVSAGLCILPFAGVVGVGTGNKFSLYLAHNFQLSGDSHLNFELIA
ncbi:hypothetical protein AWB76_03275 [Caballeronia temeraria]|uniref:Uncharacterized protein n=1 Tax=Caballeronia temeraria TaxID=1777137 RepID=A0A158AXU6_9BURK|nr:hypothetical protein [Caballeronia temeraria]SAK62595.1 hypothetical protein AWB76_03275 [Caballeronia temeraria]